MNNLKKETNKYYALDGVRTIAMLCILIMHVCANLPYKMHLSHIYKYVVFFGDFTALFMIVSAFSISCGYYNKILHGNFEDIIAFYKRRFIRIFPFFACLSLIDIVIAPSWNSAYECIANLSLGFGFIPHQRISVIGVGWTLGVIFIFYFLYPFLIFCMQEKNRYLLLLAISSFFAFISHDYFQLEKVDFLYCLIYFVVGCGLFLKKDSIVLVNRWFILVITVIVGIDFFLSRVIPHHISKFLFLSAIVIYAINVSNHKTLLSNNFMHSMSKFSFEIYLSHMFAYRILEKLNLLRIFSNYILSFAFTCFLTLSLSFFISYCFKSVEKKMIKELKIVSKV